MKHRTDIENELKTISPAVSEIGNENVFRIPPGFFEGLPAQILARIRSENRDITITANEEIIQLSPLIAGLKRQSTYSIPSGFFENLSRDINDKIDAESATAPVVSINRLNKRKRTLFAVAAAFAGITLIGSLLFVVTNNNRIQAPVALDNGSPSVATRLPDVSEDELADYLEEVPLASDWLQDNTNADFEQVAFFTLDDSNFSEMSKDISDESLSSYERDIYGQITL